MSTTEGANGKGTSDIRMKKLTTFGASRGSSGDSRNGSSGLFAHCTRFTEFRVCRKVKLTERGIRDVSKTRVPVGMVGSWLVKVIKSIGGVGCKYSSTIIYKSDRVLVKADRELGMVGSELRDRDEWLRYQRSIENIV